MSNFLLLNKAICSYFGNLFKGVYDNPTPPKHLNLLKIDTYVSL